ncbi:MAG: magnesium transporter CorA family protein [Patescibacteria group bacterium]|jgi:magnesium transporter
MKHIREIQHENFLWVNVTKQSEKELAEIGRRFDFNVNDTGECLPPFQRPKMQKRPHYYFMVLHFPVFDRETRRVSFTEVDIFLNPNYLVTVHNSQLPALENFFLECEKDNYKKFQYFRGSMAQVLFELLSRMLDAVFPSLLHINEDINSVDQKLFGNPDERKMASEILRLKTNIVTFRRTMQGHRSVIERLLMYGDRDLQLVSFQNYINSLREFVSEIWHMLESQKESINALHETNESIVNYRASEVMKIFTIISVITFPLTLMASLFAIRAGGTPLVSDPMGFWMIFGIMFFVAVLMVAVFRRKRWM